MAPQPPQLRKNFGERTANHFAVFVPQPFRAIDKLAVVESHEVRTYTNFTSFRLSCGLRRSKNRETAGIFGTGCAIVIPSPVTLLQLPPAQGFTPIPRRNAMTASANLFTFFESPVARTRTGSTPEIPLSSDQHLPHLSQNCVLRDFTLDSVRYSGVYLAKNSILSDVVG
ncbi:TPA: hypothetical protein ACGS6V_004637 [Escherichia coli]